MGAKVRVVFDEAALGDAFVRSPGTGALVASTAQGMAARAGHGCRAHPFQGRNRAMAAVWTRARTPQQAEVARRALEGAVG